MRNFCTTLLLMSTFIAATAFGATGAPGVPLPADVETKLNLSAVHAPLVKLGTQVTQKKVNVMKAVYDYSVLGGANGTTIVLRDAAGGQAVIPKNAIIKQVIVDTLASLTGSGAIMSLGINTATDLKGATIVTVFSGVQAGTPVGTAATAVKVTSSNKAVAATVSGASVTAGKFNAFIEYYLSN